MLKRTFGSTGVEVVVVGQGTWQMEADDRASCVASLRRGLDLGMTHIDTAEMYGSGEVERIVAEAIEGRRDEVFLASKVLPWHGSKKGTIQACDKSLERLKTDRLDLYMLHWPGDEPLAETIAGFEELCRAGKVLRWGVSNFDEDDLAEAVRIAGPGRVACNQVLYHLGERSIEHAVLPACEKHGVALVGYSPFGSGDFPAAGSAAGRTLAEVGRAHGASARQVALAFLTRRPAAFTIPKASQRNHAEDNAGAGSLVLSPDDLTRLEAAFPPAARTRGVPTL